MPQLARSGNRVTMWSAGCGRGEEPYTLAMLLLDAGLAGHVDATDIDAAALEEAANGTYGEEAFEELPPDMRARHVERTSRHDRPRYRVCDAVRERVRFLRHDVVSMDPPGERPYDLVAFRNVAIYLSREAQQSVFDRMVSALRPGGYLCLGEAEWPATGAAERLECFARKSKLFRATCEITRSSS